MTTGRGTGTAAERVALLLGLATRITAKLDLQEVLDETFAALRQLVDFDGGAIQLIEEGHLVAAATDPPMEPAARTVRIPIGTGVSGTIAATGEPICIADITTDERVHPEGRKKGLSGRVRSYFGVPLIMSGHPIGVLQIDSHTVDAFDEDTQALVLAFLPAVAAAVQNARLFDQQYEAVRRLEETQRLKDGFLAIVSHELRTPLTTAMGFAETLAAHADVMERSQVVDLSERILRATRRLQRLIDDVLYAANLETRLLDVAARPTDVRSVVEAAAMEDPDRGVEVVVDLPVDLPLVMADEPRLHQVMTNLLDNAAKFSPPTEPIEVSADVTVEHVDLHVDDRGRGIPESSRESIFDLFVQAEPATVRTVTGLGIGLHVVRRLCDGMGATVTVTGRDGGGTRFTVRLQRAR